MQSDYFRRRWLDFRNGHSVYLAFVLTFVNFILITYNFAIKQASFLHAIIGNLGVFILFFIGVYVPAAIVIGYWHRRNQYSIENEAYFQQNWILAWIFQFQIKQMQGKATPQEAERIMNYLDDILKKQKKDGLIEPSTKKELGSDKK